MAGFGWWVIQDGSGLADIYTDDVPGAGGRWFQCREEAGRVADSHNNARNSEMAAERRQLDDEMAELMEEDMRRWGESK